MTHYVCVGECGGISRAPGTCQAETCSKRGAPLVVCTCVDSSHRVPRSMSSVGRSIHYFGFYLLGSGFALFFFPDLTLSILGITEAVSVWTRLAGVLIFILGVFFSYAARQDVRQFFFISMFGRGIFTLGILTLVFFYGAPVEFLLFAAVDVAGLLWTYRFY